ncbi:MAG: type II/IV secretion system ATPase subunit [Candidatus Woesearchaeota archaeon]
MGFLENAKNVRESDTPRKTSKNSVSLSSAKKEPRRLNSVRKEVPRREPNSSIQAQTTSDSQSDSKIVEEASSLDIGDTEAQEFLQNLTTGSDIKTTADRIYTHIQEQKKTNFQEISQITGISLTEVEKFCDIFAEKKRVKIEYPLLFTASPKVQFIEKVEKKASELDMTAEKKLLEKYTVMSDYVVADINIWSVAKENTPIYQVIPHILGEGTDLILQHILEDLAEKTPVDAGDATDPRKVFGIKKERFDLTLESVKELFDDVDEKTAKLLAGVILHQSFGLGDLEIIMSDNWLEEIAINGNTEPLSVYHKKYGWLKTTKYFDANDSEIYNMASQIARKVGKQINALSPIMDAHLQTGDRVAATLFPVSTAGDTLTIRRFARNPWTVVHMIDPKNHTMSKEVMSFIWQAIQYELNFLVVGGTASGKTSVLNTFASLIPPTNRIISIEDTREISLPDALHWNWVPLSSKSSNAEGQGEVSMLDLMVASLRMRPDRIIVGEIRRKQQAEALFEAMHTGHSVGATMHADTAEQIKHRLTQPPIDIPENELQALQLVMVQYRDRRRGVRRTLEVAELLPGGSEEKIKLNYLYRWHARGDKFLKEESSIRVVEDLNLHTGMTEKDLQNDQTEKERILQWMLDNKMYDVNDVGHIMRIYYKYPQLLLDTISDNASAKTILE